MTIDAVGSRLEVSNTRFVMQLRLAIIALNVVLYPFLPEGLRRQPMLAYEIITFGIIYAALYKLLPSRLVLSPVSLAADCLLLASWLAVSGGLDSPFYLTWYVVIAGYAYRFHRYHLLGVTIACGAAYLATIAATDGLAGHGFDVTLRLGFMALTAAVEGLFVRERQAQLLERTLLAERVKEANRAEAWLRDARDILERKVAERTAELAAANAALQEEIKQREAAQAELRKARDRAEAASQEKSSFLAFMSHEIRTPLSAVIGFVDLLDDPALSTEDRHRYLAVLRRNGEFLTDLVSDILDLSKVEAGGLEVEWVQTSVRETINDALALFSAQAEHKGVALIAEVDDRIPAVIETDPTRLRQIVFNLLSNALKFTDDGRVILRAYLEASSLVIEVEDTGTGITPEQEARLFRPFAQAEVATTRRFGGTGLGLTVSKKLARALGGDLTLAHSAPQRGSTFVLRLPVVPPHAKAAPDERRPPAATQPPTPSLHA